MRTSGTPGAASSGGRPPSSTWCRLVSGRSESERVLAEQGPTLNVGGRFARTFGRREGGRLGRHIGKHLNVRKEPEANERIFGTRTRDVWQSFQELETRVRPKFVYGSEWTAKDLALAQQLFESIEERCREALS